MHIRTTLLAVLLGLLMPAVASAQMEPLPADTALLTGKLPNGLTYYIRHNEYPKGQADFYIAQNVGSMQEDEHQRGLAHFLEHMCFNGTEHFPGSSLRDWLETVGVKFGVNLNATTGFDQTIYNITNVPVARESVQDSVLLILRDWADGLTLDPTEIDKERGVIHEEWRRSNQGQMRILERVLPDIYPTSKYGHRLPIGLMSVVDSFPHQALRDYYEKWYRPDLQAIVVVGDIDPQRIEAKIKELFSPIRMPENPAERVYEPVPDHKGTLYAIGSDPEQRVAIAQIMFISDALPKEVRSTPLYLTQQYVMGIISTMLRNRLNELSSKPDCPFVGADVSFGGFFISDKVKDAVTGAVIAKTNDVIVPFQSLYREILRAARGGFTQTEYERARDEYLSALEKNYNNRATRENGVFVSQYVNNFTDGSHVASIETTYPTLKMMAAMIPVQGINDAMAHSITPDNRVVLIMTPEGEGVSAPTREAVEAALAAVDAEEIEAFVDEVKSEPLIPVEPTPGKIVKETKLEQWGAVEWTLSNGATVIVKPTKFKDDEILVQAYAKGGTADYPADYDATLSFMELPLSQPGLGSYSNTDLVKYTAGKQAQFNLNLGSYSRRGTGSTTPKDLPTLMELLYMSFYDLEFTPEEFEALQKAYIGYLANQEKSPEFNFVKNVTSALYKSPRAHIISPAAIEAASREKTIEVIHALTANAADYTFVFVGNVDEAVLRPLVEKYIASLPGDAATARKEFGEFNRDLFVTPGSGETVFNMNMATPQTYVHLQGMADMDQTPLNHLLASVAGQILTKRLINHVREEMGAVYSISAQGSADSYGPEAFTLQSEFPMKPEMKREVLDYIASQFKAMETDVTVDELNPVIEYMAKSYTEAREKNPYWMRGIVSWVGSGIDHVSGDVERVNSLTPADVMAWMKALNAAGNYRVITLEPAQ